METPFRVTFSVVLEGWIGSFIKGCDRRQTLLADCIDDYVGAENPDRVIDVFVDELDLAGLGLEGAAATGRPGYHPAMLLKLYLYGYMNHAQSSRRVVSALVVETRTADGVTEVATGLAG